MGKQLLLQRCSTGSCRRWNLEDAGPGPGRGRKSSALGATEVLRRPPNSAHLALSSSAPQQDHRAPSGLREEVRQGADRLVALVASGPAPSPPFSCHPGLRVLRSQVQLPFPFTLWPQCPSSTVDCEPGSSQLSECKVTDIPGVGVEGLSWPSQPQLGSSSILCFGGGQLSGAAGSHCRIETATLERNPEHPEIW